MDQLTYYPKISQALGLLVLVVLLQLALFIPIVILGTLLRAPLAEHPLAIGFVNLGAIGMALLLGIKRNRVSFREILPFRPVHFSLFLPISLTVAGLSILLSETDNLLRSALPMPPGLAELFERVLASPKHRWASALTLVIIAPLSEESLFRGLILRGFRSHYSLRKAIVASAILFGLIHLNPWQFIGAVVWGVLFAWWFVQTGSLLPCLFGHALNNALPLIFLSIFDFEIKGYTSGFSEQVEFQPLWFNALGLLLAGLGIWLLVKAFGRINKTRFQNVLTTP